ncbi:MAG: DUF504 domain-containing protein [Deltaproteobacteria bacterium]
MLPIQDLLNRIRWDEKFGWGRFEIGYYDRLENRIVKIPFTEIDFPAGDHFCFRIAGGSEEPLSIPFHRVRKVWKDGIVIWERKADD